MLLKHYIYKKKKRLSTKYEGKKEIWKWWKNDLPPPQTFVATKSKESNRIIA
jgi:hypothetical protein